MTGRVSGQGLIFRIFLKFKESKKPTQFKLSNADQELSSDPEVLKDCLSVNRSRFNAFFTLERARPWFVTLTTSAAGHDLHQAFSKQPGINDRKSNFRKSNEPIISELLYVE